MLEHEEPCIEQGWVAVAAMGCDVGDPERLLAAANLALDRARRFGDVNLETKALADGGLAHVQAGRVQEGMAMLDEAMALACGPTDDQDVAGRSACSFFTACYYSADFERAASWADLLRARGLIGPVPGAPIFLSNHCDTVQATLQCELGRWTEAETLLVRASTGFTAVTGMPSWHAGILLADLRTRQGRHTDAEDLLLGRDQAYEALLPWARLHLARGDHDLAATAARRGLRGLRADRLRAIELLTVLVVGSARLRDQAGDHAGAVLDATAAAATLAALDVVIDPADRELLDRLAGVRPPDQTQVARLEREGAWWDLEHGGTSVRIRSTKGLCYLAELVANPGVERHALDLVDRVEGVGDVPRRSLGDAGEILDGRARTAYRRRVEELRARCDDALEAGALERAEALQGELDHLVAQLAQAFGLGGGSRRASSAAEKARLNVTRAIRSAIDRIEDALPDAGAALDRHVRTGLYAAYEPVSGELRWVTGSLSPG